MSQPKFSDTKAREWFPHLDFAKLRRIREIGVDFGNAEQIGRIWAELLLDDLKSLDVIWLAVSRDGTTADDFQAAMDGDTLEAAREALRQALINFTPPARRATVEAATAGVQQAYLTVCRETTEKVTKIVAAGVENARRHGVLPPESPESSGTSTTAGH